MKQWIPVNKYGTNWHLQGDSILPLAIVHKMDNHVYVGTTMAYGASQTGNTLEMFYSSTFNSVVAWCYAETRHRE